MLIDIWEDGIEGKVTSDAVTGYFIKHESRNSRISNKTHHILTMSGAFRVTKDQYDQVVNLMSLMNATEQVKNASS